MSHLIIQNLHKSFAELRALQGPSAAGKTTTLRAVCGIGQVDQGRILFNGEDVTPPTISSPTPRTSLSPDLSARRK